MSFTRIGPASQRRLNSGRRREASVHVNLHAVSPGKIGPVLDLLVPVLQEILGALLVEGVTGEVEIPDYHQVFYGWEDDQDDRG